MRQTIRALAIAAGLSLAAGPGQAALSLSAQAAGVIPSIATEDGLHQPAGWDRGDRHGYWGKGYRYDRGWGGPRGYGHKGYGHKGYGHKGHGRGGYWHKGHRGGRYGWWWIVGPRWYWGGGPSWRRPGPLVLVPPAPVWRSAPQVTPNAYCREWRGDATIDATGQPFWGTACLQPDGSWRIVN